MTTTIETLHVGCVFWLVAGRSNPRPAIVLAKGQDRYLYITGTSVPPAEGEPHVVVYPEEPWGQALELSKRTFFRSRWCLVQLLPWPTEWMEVDRMAGDCPDELLQELGDIIPESFRLQFLSREAVSDSLEDPTLRSEAE